MEKRWCSACGRPYEPSPQSPRQTYCSNAECQKARKLLWQRTKRRTDPDYHQSQLEAQLAWRDKNHEYWKDYRQKHPEYVEANREQQKVRNRRRLRTRPALLAKNDVSSDWPSLQGLFWLIALRSSPASPQVCIVHLTPVSAATP